MTRRHALLVATAALAAGLALAGTLAEALHNPLQAFGGDGGLPPPAGSDGGAPGLFLPLLAAGAALTLGAARFAAQRRGAAFLLAAMGATALFPLVALQVAGAATLPLGAVLHVAATGTLWAALLLGAGALGRAAPNPRPRVRWAAPEGAVDW